MFKKGYKMSDEHKRKISLANKNKKRSEETKKLLREISLKLMNTPQMKNKISVLTRLGMNNEETRKKLSENNGMKRPEIARKVSLALKGRPTWMKGKKHTEETRFKLSISRRGKCLKEANPNWRGGITTFNELFNDTEKYKNWRNEVFQRDNYTCQECGDDRGGNLEAHHIEPLSILKDRFLREYSQFSPIEDKETLLRLSTTYTPFWELYNGITLCIKCHIKYRKETHKKISLYRRSVEQGGK